MPLLLLVVEEGSIGGTEYVTTIGGGVMLAFAVRLELPDKPVGMVMADILTDEADMMGEGENIDVVMYLVTDTAVVEPFAEVSVCVIVHDAVIGSILMFEAELRGKGGKISLQGGLHDKAAGSPSFQSDGSMRTSLPIEDASEPYWITSLPSQPEMHPVPQ